MQTGKGLKGQVSLSAKAGFHLNTKGQVSFYDFLIAMMLFLIAFTVLNTLWTSNYYNAVGTIATTEMESKALQALNALLKTKGYPENWNSGNVEIIGLCSKKNTIDETKLDKFVTVSYGITKEKMKLGGYDFLFEFDAEGVDDDKAFGSVPAAGQNVVSLKRIVEYKGGSAVVEFKVFR